MGYSHLPGRIKPFFSCTEHAAAYGIGPLCRCDVKNGIDQSFPDQALHGFAAGARGVED